MAGWLQFKADSERQNYEKLLMAILIFAKRLSREDIAKEIYIFTFRFVIGV